MYEYWIHSNVILMCLVICRCISVLVYIKYICNIDCILLIDLKFTWINSFIDIYKYFYIQIQKYISILIELQLGENTQCINDINPELIKHPYQRVM